MKENVIFLQMQFMKLVSEKEEGICLVMWIALAA